MISLKIVGICQGQIGMVGTRADTPILARSPPDTGNPGS
jgi:hypothetical protein